MGVVFDVITELARRDKPHQIDFFLFEGTLACSLALVCALPLLLLEEAGRPDGGSVRTILIEQLSDA